MVDNALSSKAILCNAVANDDADADAKADADDVGDAHSRQNSLTTISS